MALQLLCRYMRQERSAAVWRVKFGQLQPARASRLTCGAFCITPDSVETAQHVSLAGWPCYTQCLYPQDAFAHLHCHWGLSGVPFVFLYSCVCAF